jgi:DNA polymerase-1
VKNFLSQLFFARTAKSPASPALTDAIGTLRGRATFGGPEHPVYVRLAELGGRVYLDLGDAAWRAIEIGPTEWRVIADPPVRFRRPNGMLALPLPVSGGSLTELRRFINVSDKDFALIETFLVMALHPSGPYPVLIGHGEHGSGKTFGVSMLRAIVDPNKAMTRGQPRDEWDLVIAAQNGLLVTLDNLSKVPDWLSDALCRLATGGGLGARKLFTDDEETIVTAKRPVMMTSIEEITFREDLLDRSIAVDFRRMRKGQRKDEKDSLWPAFEAGRPRILGALLDVAVVALGNINAVPRTSLSGMADFCVWGMAAAPALGWTAKEFLAALEDNRKAASEIPLGASPLVNPIRQLVEFGPYEGLVSELLTQLSALADEQTKRRKEWPKDAIRLSGALRRLAPALRVDGINVTFFPRTGAGVRVRIERQDDDRPDDDDAIEPPEPLAANETESCEEQGKPTTSTTPIYTQEGNPQARGVVNAVDVDDLHVLSRVSFPAPGYELVTESARTRELVPQLLTAARLGLDTETTGLDPRSHRIRLLQLATDDGVYLFDLFEVDPRLLVPVLQRGQRLLVHNGKFDVEHLAATGLAAPTGERFFDTMLAAQLLGAGSPEGRLGQCGLAAVCERYLGVQLDKTAQLADWSGHLSDEMLAYAARDAAVLVPLATRLEEEIAAAALERAFAIEMRALPAIAWLEQTGAPFDAAGWTDLSTHAVAEQRRLEHELTAVSGAVDLFGGPAVNWASPEQVRALLAVRGHSLTRTDETTLRTIAATEPLAALLLAHREASRKASTYGSDFLKHVHAATGRIHADYLQLGSAAGRMSCVKPNLQNIPRDPLYRACFRAPGGRSLVKADYSQIELRIAAEIAHDRRLLAVYAAGGDVHVETAAAVLGRVNGAVRPEDRQAAKALNFGLLYGMGADRLREHAANEYGVELTEREAIGFRGKFFGAYPGLRNWHRGQPDGAVETRTLAGRRRLNIERYTEKLNSPVQGSGADGLKAALGQLWETREQCPGAAPILTVHDEIVVECDSDATDAAQAWVTDAMRHGMEEVVNEVPVVVEAKAGQDWSLS